MSPCRHSVPGRALIAAIAACVTLAACAALQPHSAGDYQKAAALGNPDGSLTTIVGPDAAIVDLAGVLQFPQGDAARTHSVLMYDGPAVAGGTCRFHAEYANRFGLVTKGPQVAQPCDGKQWARFHIGGIDTGFVAHLHDVTYKGTAVTLLEISSHDVPAYLRVVY